MKPLKPKDQMRFLHQENRRYPRELQKMPPPWPPMTERMNPIAVWRSSTFLLVVIDEPDAIRLTINRTMVKKDGHWQDDVTWDDLQRLKREAGYGDRLAIEFYPPDRDVVNVANMRHLWLPKFLSIPQHWRKDLEVTRSNSEVPYV